MAENKNPSIPPSQASYAEMEADLHLLKQAVESSITAIIVTGPNRRDNPILYVNPAFERLTGYEAHEAIGRNCRFLQGDDHDQRGLDELREALREGRDATVTLRNYKKSGELFYNELFVSPVRDKAGRITHFIGVQSDVTDRRYRESLQGQQFKLLVESVTEYAIFLLDPEGKIVTWNQGAERINGYTDEEVIGNHFEMLYLPEDREAGRPCENLEEVRKRGRFEEQAWRQNKNGKCIWMDVVMTAIHDERGNLIGYSKVTRDITEQERVKEQQQQIESLKEAEHLKEQFLSILSHELRTPINALMGFGSLLEDGVMGDMSDLQRKTIGKMLSSADVLLNLVNDLLDMSRMYAGKFSIAPHPMRFQDVAEDVVGALSALLDQRHLTLVNEVPDDLACITADEQRIRQVMTNLIGNAIKFSNDGGTITVRARIERGATLLCEVEDTGIGISEANIARLFQRFTQVDTSNTRKQGGTGLGLAIAKVLIESHGGEIGVRSDEGLGSTFWFALPVSPRAEAVVPEA